MVLAQRITPPDIQIFESVRRDRFQVSPAIGLFRLSQRDPALDLHDQCG